MNEPYSPMYLEWTKSYGQEVSAFKRLIEMEPADRELLLKEYEQLTGEPYESDNA
jgi:hypothetical protein